MDAGLSVPFLMITRIFMIGILALQAAAGIPPLCRIAYAAQSTPTASGYVPSPISFTFVKDTYDLRFETSYNLRWDFEDIKNIYPGLVRFVSNPVGSIRRTNWDIVDNTRFRLYGLTIDPWEIIIEREAVSTSSSAYSGGSGRGAQKPASGRRKFRISFVPVIKDIQRDLDKGIRRGMLEEFFRRMGPPGAGLDYKSKKIFIRDVLSVYDSWDLPDSALPKSGLEYMIEEPE